MDKAANRDHAECRPGCDVAGQHVTKVLVPPKHFLLRWMQELPDRLSGQPHAYDAKDDRRNRQVLHERWLEKSQKRQGEAGCEGKDRGAPVGPSHLFSLSQVFMEEDP